jgi:hypothetical protein
LVNEELPAHRVVFHPRPASTARRIHLIEARPREFDNRCVTALLNTVVDRGADRDQLHLAHAVAFEGDVGWNYKVKRLLIPHLRLNDSPPALDQSPTFGHRALFLSLTDRFQPRRLIVAPAAVGCKPC